MSCLVSVSVFCLGAWAPPRVCANGGIGAGAAQNQLRLWGDCMPLVSYVSVTDPLMKLDTKAGATMARRSWGWSGVGSSQPVPDHPLAHASGSLWILLLMNCEDSSPVYFRVPCRGVREPEVLMLGC